MDRRTYLGGSDVAAVLGISPWRTAYEVWLQKRAPDPPVPQPPTPVQKRGQRLEPVILQMLIDESQEGHEGLPPLLVVNRNERYRHPTYDFLAAEIDAEAVIDTMAVQYPVNIEIKSANPRWSRAWGESGTDEIPLHYAAQVIHGLAVTGRRKCIVGALIGIDDFRWYIIEPDDAVVDGVVRMECDFWFNHVLMGESPPLRTLADVDAAYATDIGDTMLADSLTVGDIESLHELRAHIDDLSKDADELELRIKKAMGSHAALVDETGRRLATWKTSTRTTLDLKRLQSERPRLCKLMLARFNRSTSTRTFRLTQQAESQP